MKIALLLTGGLRNFEDTYSSFKHYLLDVYDIDVFFYGLSNKFGIEQNTVSFVEKFKPKKYIINDNSYYEKFEVNKSYIKSSFFSFYNVLKCNELRKEYEKENDFEYDLIIRSRLDYFWFRRIDEIELEEAKNFILTPVDWSFKSVNTFALSDIFAIGNRENMDIYCQLFHKIDDYCKFFKFHPESLVGFHISNSKLPSKEINRHFIFEYPDSQQYNFIPIGCKFVKHFDGMNKNRKDFD